MSKSVKNRETDFESKTDNYDHRQHLHEKRLKSALRSKNRQALFNLIEEDDY